MGKLPRAVEEQGKRADELLKQFGVSQNPPAANPPAVNEAPVTPAPVIPDSEYVNANQDTDPNAQTPPVTQTPPEPVTPQPVTPSPQPCPECAKWQQRYSVLQGKYNAEVPRLSGRISYLENQVQDLLTKTNSMPAANPAGPASNPSPVVATTSFSDLLKSSEDPALKSFNQNFPDVAGPIGKLFDEFGSQISKKSDERLAAIEKASQENKQTEYIRDLNKAHPDWQTVCQGDSQWPIWLNTDNGYGITRLDALRKANANFDSKVVSKLLTDFKKETGLTSVPNNPGSDPRARQVTPSSGPSGARGVTPQNQGPEPVARSFITQFAMDLTRGKYRGREEEVKAIQAKIDAAVADGKVLNK